MGHEGEHGERALQAALEAVRIEFTNGKNRRPAAGIERRRGLNMRKLVSMVRSNFGAGCVSYRAALPIRGAACSGLLLAAGVCLWAGPADAQSVADLIRDPERYLDRQITLAAFCYASDPGYLCAAVGEPLEVRANLLSGSAKKAVDENCGGMDALEKTPLPECRFTIRFTLASVTSEAGPYIRNNKAVRGRITVLGSDRIEASRGGR